MSARAHWAEEGLQEEELLEAKLSEKLKSAKGRGGAKAPRQPAWVLLGRAGG